MNPIPDRRLWRPTNRHRTNGIFLAGKSTIRNTGLTLWIFQARACARACGLPGAGSDGTVIVGRMAVD